MLHAQLHIIIKRFGDERRFVFCFNLFLQQKGELSNAELRILTEELGKIRFGENEARIKHISVRGLLPDTEHYMTYEGSTTAPGCHETVTWIVLNKPIYITLQQVSHSNVAAGATVVADGVQNARRNVWDSCRCNETIFSPKIRFILESRNFSVRIKFVSWQIKYLAKILEIIRFITFSFIKPIFVKVCLYTIFNV